MLEEELGKLSLDEDDAISKVFNIIHLIYLI